MLGLEDLQCLDVMQTKTLSLLTTPFDISSIKWSKKTKYIEIFSSSQMGCLYIIDFIMEHIYMRIPVGKWSIDL